jgi:hypothetical protein
MKFQAFLDWVSLYEGYFSVDGQKLPFCPLTLHAFLASQLAFGEANSFWSGRRLSIRKCL